MLDVFSITEAQAARARAGLPEAVGVSDSLHTAFLGGVVKQSDLVPNVAASIRTEYPVPDTVQPPLSIFENLERRKVILGIASTTVGHYLQNRG
jgi:hypothetical protein